MEFKDLPLEEWTENHVSSWLKSIKVKDQYIQKLHKDEVTGPVLMGITKDFLKDETGMKPGQIQLLLSKRNELLKPPQQHETQSNEQPVLQKKEAKESSAENKKQQTEKKNQKVSVVKEPDPAKKESSTEKTKTGSESSRKRDCNPRPFDTEVIDFKYVKNTVLQPENGNTNLITPCHEYKSLDKAVRLDRQKLQAKFANEVLRFACGCMNVRTNGTIHFGVMDSVEDTKNVHGEIVGIPVTEKDIYVDALNYIGRCVTDPYEKEQFELCVRSPKFIEVIDKQDSDSHLYVVEVDIEPAVSIVRGQLYTVRLPKFNKETNKVEFEKSKSYRRAGTKTEPISDEERLGFAQRVVTRDNRREQAESTAHRNPSDNCEDLGRKLSVLLTGGKKYMDDSLRYIIVTNKCEHENLKYINFLLHMNIFCVFDFDPDSKSSGLCSQYQEHHATNLHFLQNYANESGMSTSDFIKDLQLFDQTSWIFCNGRSDYRGDEKASDAKTWIKNKKKHLKKAISMLCNEILPKGSFVVLFVLMSSVEQPLIDTFHEFYAEMNGHEDIVCISESKENYTKWASLAQVSCSFETLNQISIVGMKMCHIDVTVQNIQLSPTQYTKQLPVFNKMLCTLRTAEDERLSSLEVLSVNLCDNTNPETIQQEKVIIERYFYQGGKVRWINFWLADKQLCEAVIERDAYLDVANILDSILKCKIPVKSVDKINIYHQPGSGGSTVARQLLWNFRKELRCAVVKPSCSFKTVCEHAVQLREYEEKDRNNCLPVLLLVEDCDEEYLDDLSHELGNAIASMQISLSLCFILLNCKRSHDPEKKCKALPLRTVAVTHKLTEREKKLFSRKREKLTEELQPEFILTFVLMSYGFEKKYIQDFVENLLQGIDHSSLETRLIRYVALLNCYVQNSYISVSHCEAFLGLGVQMDRFRHQNFERSLTEEARLLFIHLRESTTHISSVRIVHPSVAEEILHQLSKIQPQSTIANALLQEKVLFNHRFGKGEYMKFIRDLFIKRYRSKGDNSSFSPLIEHVCTVEKNPAKAMDLLKTAYTCSGKDPFFAQQLARLYYTNLMFEEAKHWAEVAKSHQPHNSFFLDTEGQVYRKWFNVKHDSLDKGNRMAETVTEIIGIALKAIECFRASEKAAKSEADSMNNSGYFGEVDIGCRLLKLISSVNVFANENGPSKLMQYLLTDHIPEEVKRPWHNFHSRLKGLQKGIYEALEWISEDLSYFQTEKNEEEESSSKELEQVYNPRKWLLRKTSVYARFFSDASFNLTLSKSADSLTLLARRMNICRLGGGNVTEILFLLSDKTEKPGRKLEQIISMYPEDLQREKLDHIDLVNYIFCQIALGCALPCSQKLVTLQKLQELSLQFHKERNNTSPPSAFFLLSLLFWPDESQDREPSQHKNNILMSAIDALKRHYDIKIKNVPSRKKRIFTHFFLGRGKGLDRFIHKSKLEKLLKGPLNERRLKWLSGEVWSTPEIAQLLKRVKGWTENGVVFVQGTCKSRKITVIPLYSASKPNSNENLTFYLGFSFNGPVAYDIQVSH